MVVAAVTKPGGDCLIQRKSIGFGRDFGISTATHVSRFLNLEFDGDSESRLTGSPGTPVRDETFYIGEATTAFQNGNFESALRLYGKVIEFNPNNPSAWTGQVRMLIELGEFKEAKLWADKALERFPREAELLAAKAVALGRCGDIQGAMVFSDAAVEERGDTPYVWLARGDVLLGTEERRAESCIEKALLLAPGDWLIRWLAARIEYYYDRFGSALKFLKEAVEINASHFLLWLELGQCQQALGLLRPARDSFGVARQLNPRCSEASLRLTRVSHAGMREQVRGWWRRLFKR